MNLKDLHYFHQLVRFGNFTKVAEYSDVSQPTVTYAIKRLEEAFGAKLIIRNQAHHSITVTEAGRILETHIQAILEEIENAHTEIDRLKVEKLEIGLPPIIGNYYFPKLSVQLFEQDLIQDIQIINGGSQDLFRLLKNGKIDLALLGSTEPIREEQLESELLGEKRFMIVVSPKHRLAQRESVSFAELKDESFVLLNEHYVHPNGFKKLAQQAHFTPNIVYQNSDLNILKGMIREQIGIGFLAEIAIHESDNLVSLPISDYPQPSFLISLVQANNIKHSATQERVIDLIRHSY